jgi:hypothetical protein
MPRKLLAAAALLIAGLAVAALWVNPARTADGPGAKAAPYVHVVVFHVKKDAPAGEADALVADAHELLRPIPSVRDLRVGKPAAQRGNLAKSDYQVALVIFFDDYEGLMAYDKHPLHQKYVERHLKHIELEKLAVYDFLHEKK